MEYIPITDKYYHTDKSSMAGFDDIFSLGYQSAAAGYYFGEHKDHMSTPAIKDETDREAFADRVIALIDKIVENIDIRHILDQIAELKKNQNEVTSASMGFLPTRINPI